jgi:DNA-binding CsgD family transcriptional regulator
VTGESEIDGLVGDIYEAALDEALWLSVGARLAHRFHANSAVIQVQEPQGGALLATAGAAAGYCDDAYRAYYWQRDLWAQKGMELGFGRIVSSREMGDEAAFARTEFYADICRKLDIFHVLGTPMKLEDGRAASVAVHRPRRSGHFDDSEIALFVRLAPHLARALRIRMRLVSAPTVVQGDASQSLAESNERPVTAPCILRCTFGLTPVEARIAIALAEGLAPADIARASGTSVHTVRSHLKHVRDKTGTTRQAQVVALVHRTTALG